jgi:small subunit ribosomal protein S9
MFQNSWVLKLTKKKENLEIGTRKAAMARASARPGTGKVFINGMPLNILEPEMSRLMIMEPLEIADVTAKKFDFNVNVQGGGVIGQASAVRQAISKILAKHDKTLRKKFLDYDRSLLVADARRTEPHKPSRSSAGPRRHKQRSKR